VVRFLKRQSAVSAAVAAAVGAVVFLAYGVAYQTEAVTGVSPREFGTWATLSYLLGATFAVVAEWVAAWASRHASVRVASGARRSIDESLQIALRAGAVPGVVVSALCALGLAGMFLAMLAAAGGLGDSAGPAFAKATRFPLLLAGFALGAAFVALLGQLGGGIFGKVADIGADVAGKLEASLPEDSADNPAVVADLVGDSVNDGAGGTASVLAVVTCEALAAMLAAAMVYRHNPHLPSVTAFVLYPLVARVFGLLSTCFGIFVVRTDDTETPMNALSRGLYVATLLYAVGAVGCAKWLLGPHWMAYGGSAAIGAAASVVCLFVAQYYSEQKHRPVRSLAEAARGGATLATLRGMVTATESAGAFLLVSAATAMASYYLGASTGLADGGLLGIAIAVGGLLGSAPYVLAMVSLGSITDTAGGLVEMTVARERPDVRARVRLLDAVGTTAKGFARSLASVGSSLASLLLVTLFLREVWEAAGSAHAGIIDVTRPSLYLAGVFGLLVVLAFAWTVLLRIVSAARALVQELRVQLSANAARLEAEADTVADAPEPTHIVDAGDDVGWVPNLATDRARSAGNAGRPRPADVEAAQLACVEIVSRIALRGMLAPVFVGLGLPLLVGAALRLWATDDRVTTSAEAIVALLLVATIAGALGSLLFTNAGSAWDNAKKYIETGAHGGRYLTDVGAPTRPSGVPPAGAPGARTEIDNPTYLAAVVGDTIGDPLKGVLGPPTQALVKTLATLALVFLPFFL
jgi:K(+)-stimulated pyrophosphate-energized sodium pump